MTPSHLRVLTSEEAKFNLLARFSDDRRARIESRKNSLSINFSCVGSRPSRKGSLVDLRFQPARKGRRSR